MSWREVIECLSEGEGPNIEFLVSIESSEQLVKYIISFLNSKGGRIVIGIDDKNNHLIGSNITKIFIESLMQKIEPAIALDIEEIPRISNKVVIFIRVPEGTAKPYSYRSKYYFKNGKDVNKHTKDEIYNLVGTQQDSKLNNRQTQALAYLELNKQITNRKFRELYSVSHKTAHLELTAMFNKAIIGKTGQGRNTSYILI